jgi:trehalose-6-phosphate synthase
LSARSTGNIPASVDPPVHYLYQSVEVDELVALYLAADVMLVTPLRDGMNLVAKEYVACRVDATGALVLSEFAGAAQELRDAILVNPHDLDGLKQAIRHAVDLDPSEGTARMRRMRRIVRRHDVQAWARTFLAALHDVRPPTPRKGVTGGHRPKTVWTALARRACWPSTDWAASAVASSSGRPLVQPPISFL